MKKVLLAVLVSLSPALIMAHGGHESGGNVFSLTKDYAFNSLEIGYTEDAPSRVIGRERLWGLKVPLMQFHRRAAMDFSTTFVDGMRKADLHFPLLWSEKITVTPAVSYLEEIDGFGFSFKANIKLR